MKKSLILTLILLMAPVSSFAQSKAHETARQKVLENVGNLSDDLTSKQTTLLSVIKLSAVELSDLKEKLETLKDLSPKQVELRDYFINLLNEYLTYYQAVQTEISADNVSLENIKLLAETVNLWRENNHVPTVKKIVEFVLVLKGRDALKIADARYAKIADDLKRFNSLEVLSTAVLQPILAEAGNHLEKARQKIDAADLWLLDYLPSEEIAAESGVKEITILQLLEGTFEEIKQAYKQFLKMGTLVRKVLSR